ncbi:hypothetical protein [Paenibacillus whitsoniae]|uniref:Type 4 fimbrial biogenesis protein PilX N-terminal domain-containing protein n=1 Tax=Paenibacillus whitsoniae TaxID=2496558 RepID=A0A430J453_9BACL|nr:hypothetical protein [Paenibacillus whitsoniae]RTE01416.1 hypothetical protein EJQ19_30950 [Paenibacillus whitsoniae]
MRLRWRDEKGAALLLVLFIIVVFTMIGMAVISASIGGAVRTETKQKDVQSVHLAEKALNEAVAIVKGKLAGYETINLDQLPADLNDWLIDIENRNGEVREDYAEQYGEGEAGIVIHAFLNPEKNVDEGRPVITITSTATIKGVQRVLQQDIEINSFPDILNYAAGSEEGDFVINGSPYFLGSDNNGGNLYAGKKLLIKNQAEYYYQSDAVKKEGTTFPTLNGIAYVQSLDNIQYCDSSLTPLCDNYKSIKEFSGDVEAKEANQILRCDNMSEEECQTKLQIKNKKDFIGINMKDSFVDKLTEAIGGSKDDREKISNQFANKTAVMQYLISSGKLAKISPLKPNGSETSEQMDTYTTEMADFQSYINGVNKNGEDYHEKLEASSQGSILYRGDFHINNEDFSKLEFSTEAKEHHSDDNNNGFDDSNWFIIFGDLDISNTSRTPVKIRANLLVTGNVTIRGKVDMNATLFTLGQTVIEDATIRGLEELDSKGNPVRKELVLFSAGSILITRVNTEANGTFKRIPENGFTSAVGAIESEIQILDAFFYTDSTADLYGVGSIFWINGGFFSKGKLTINALRGNADVTSDEYIEGEGNQIGQSAIAGDRARFIISYNNSIIEDQAAALPRVNTVQLIRGKRVMP